MKLKIPYCGITLDYSMKSKDDYYYDYAEYLTNMNNYPVKFNFVSYLSSQSDEINLSGADLILKGSDGYYYYLSWTVGSTFGSTAFTGFKLDLDLLDKLLNGYSYVYIFFNSLHKFGKIFKMCIRDIKCITDDIVVTGIFECHIDNFPYKYMLVEFTRLIGGIDDIKEYVFSEKELVNISKYLDRNYHGINLVLKVPENFDKKNILSIKRNLLIEQTLS